MRWSVLVFASNTKLIEVRPEGVEYMEEDTADDRRWWWWVMY